MIGSVLSADVFARYLRLKGEDVVFVSGSDEHGTPIEVEAIRKKVNPKEYTDKMHKIAVEVFKKWGISFTNYSRTENPVHIKFVQEFYKKVEKKGYIFTKIQEMLYCPHCNRFLPDRFVEGTCPYCGYEKARGDQCDKCGRMLEPTQLINPRCVICGETPIVKETKHWFFNLAAFQDDLRKYIEENKQFPENARNFSLQLIKEGLKPRSLTRDNKWGIPAPFEGAEGKTIYVWMEAVLGYVSATIEWSKKIGREDAWKDYWFDKNTKSVYFIAKDNIPFHTLIFPALLMASGEGYVLPWQVASTEFLLFEGEKFSKSRGVGIDALRALDLFPADYYRYALISLRPETRDSSFKWDTFVSLINDELNDIVGNFVHRILTFAYKNFDKKIPPRSKITEGDEEIIELLKSTPDKVGANLERFSYRAALQQVINLMRVGNQYFTRNEVWKVIKTNKERAATVINLCAQLIGSFSILIEPFLPFTAEKLWSEILGLEGSVHEQQWEKAKEFLVPENHVINKPKPIFKKIEKPEI